MSITMSISSAPCETSSLVSQTFVAVVLLPCGKPTTVPTATAVPRSASATDATSAGRTHTDAVRYSTATAKPASMSAGVSSGRSNEWSIIFATSSQVGTPRSRVLEAEVRAGKPQEIDALYQGENKEVVAITRIRLFDDTPIAIEHAVFPAGLSALLTTDLETGSLHNALRRLGLTPTLGSSVLTARTADGDAPHLGVAPATPMLVETRSIVDQHGSPLEFTISSYVADRYALKVDFAVAQSRD